VGHHLDRRELAQDAPNWTRLTLMISKLDHHDADAHNAADASTDAIVIGAGVIGSAVVYELARRGLETICVDKLPAAGYGSTSASSAVVRLNYSTEAGMALAYEGLHYWKAWAEYVELDDPGPLIELVRHTKLMPRLEDGEHFDRVVGLMLKLGIEHEVISADEAEARHPSIDLHRFGPPAALDDVDAPFWADPTARVEEVLVMPLGGYVSDPQLAAQNLADAAKAKGAAFRFNTEVTAVLRTGDRVAGVQLSDGTELRAPIVVNVAGPHSPVINAMAGVLDDMNIKTRPMKREVFVVPAPKGVDYEAEGVMIGDLDVGVYFRPERGNNILIGSTEPECDPLTWIDDPDAVGDALDDDEHQLLVLRTARRVRDLGVPHTKRGVVSSYDVSEDWVPIYDRTSLDGFYVAIGTSGNQFKNAASAAHCVAELITAVEAGHDHDADPLQVVGRYTGLSIDMATFSRNRTVDTESSMTVMG